VSDKVKIDVTWPPEKKALVAEYAKAKGWSFNLLVETILTDHVEKKPKKRAARR
jgi:predicted HicB family RNase H-like nuclease